MSEDKVDKIAGNIVILLFVLASAVGMYFIVDWIGFSWALLGKLVLLDISITVFWAALKELVSGE